MPLPPIEIPCDPTGMAMLLAMNEGMARALATFFSKHEELDRRVKLLESKEAKA